MICLVDLVEGDVYSWGDGPHGQLGRPSNNSHDQPGLITTPNNVKFKDCGAGYFHSALVSVEGDLYTFGDPRDGSLGFSTLNLVKEPTLVLIPFKIKQISCGLYHTTVLSGEASKYTVFDHRDCFFIGTRVFFRRRRDLGNWDEQ